MKSLQQLTSIAIIAIIILSGCNNQPKENASTDTKADTTSHAVSESAKSTRVYRHIDIRLGEFDDGAGIGRSAADSALMIASFIYNSHEFQDSVSHLLFSYRNRCNDCGGGKILPRKPKVSGQEILDSIFRKSEVKYHLTLLNERTGGLGATCPNTAHTTSRYWVVKGAMDGNTLAEDSLPFNYAYAVHLCHEYSHEVGFCHWWVNPSVNREVAEAMGEVAYCYALKFYKDKTVIKK